MEELIKKLKIDVSCLQLQLKDNGITPDLKAYRSKVSGGGATEEEKKAEEGGIPRADSGLRAAQAKFEDLNLQLTELTNEYEHYREIMETKVDELKDKLEK